MRAPLARWTASLGARILSGEDDEDDHDEDVTDQGVGAIIFALAIGVISRSYLRSVVPLPYTVQVLVVGIGIGLILEHTDDAGLGEDLSVSLDSIRFMDPEIIFYALLPILIFESAFFTDVHIFLREMWQVLMLAGPGVIVATIMMACFSKFFFPYDWDWNTSLYFGAMTSATDPVAVVALMKELGVSERLAVLIEGESLLNDGTSIVVFSVFFNAATGAGSTSVSTVVTQFARLGLGGPVVGLITGIIGAFTVGYILEDHLSEITCTVVVCFSAFLLAEATILEVSGVLAVVIGGLYMSFYGRPRISPSVQEPLHAFWSLWGYMANTVIFFVTGLDAATKAFGKDSSIEARDWGYLVALWVAVHIVRGFVVLISYPVLRHGYGTNWKQLTVLTYAGLRGAVGLTLALIVQEDSAISSEIGDKIMFMMAGLAIMTLLINGTTCGQLIHFFGMDRATKAQTEIFIRACSAVESKLEHVVEQLKKDRFLGDSDWPVVWRYVPVMTSRVYWHRIRYGSVVLANGEDEEIQGGNSSKWCPKCCGAGGLCHTAVASLPARGLNQFRWASGLDVSGRGAGGGGRFAHLPPRLRPIWQRYHRQFHITEEVEEEGGVDRVIESNITGDYGNENYRAVDDQTVHMPRPGTARRSWSPDKAAGGDGGSGGGGTGSGLSFGTHFPSVKGGLRSFVSHMTQSVGNKGSGTLSVGPASRSGTSLDLVQGGIGSRDSRHHQQQNQQQQNQQQQNQQQPRQHHRRKTGEGVVGATGLDVSGRGIRGLDLSGRGKRSLDRSGRGTRSGEDRARSPPGTEGALSPGVGTHEDEKDEEAPVLDFSGRGLLRGVSRRETVAMAREKQDEGKEREREVEEGEAKKQPVVDGKRDDGATKKTGMGRRVDSAPSGLQVTSSHGFFSRAAEGVGGLRRGQQQQQRRRQGEGQGMGGHVVSMSELDKAANVPRRRMSASNVSSVATGSQHRGLAAAATAAAAAAAGTGDRDGLETVSVRTAEEIVATTRALNEAKERLREADETLKDAVREVEEAAKSGPHVAKSRESQREQYYQRQQQQQQQAQPAYFTRPAAAVAAAGVTRLGALGDSRRSVTWERNRSKHALVSAENLEQLAEARLRFVAAVKANYQDNFRKGWLSDSGLRVLQGNADVQLDDGYLPLQEWTRLRESFTIPDYQLNMASALRYLPFVGQVVGGWIFKKLAFVFELASNFIAAHEDIAILELLPEGDAADQLAKENLKQLDDASGTLGQQLPAFPEVARSLKTQVAARFLLAKHREFVEELYLDGFINEKERETILRVNTEFKIKLDDHPYAEHLPPRSVMLSKVPFLKSLPEEQLVSIVDDDSFCQEELHGSNVVLLRQSERGKHSGHSKGASGWYYIVRGSVQMVSVSQDRDSGGGSAGGGGAGGAGGAAGDSAEGEGDAEPVTPGAGEGTVAEGTEGVRIREHPLHAGAVFGMTDAMLGMPYRATYTTTSFVHLFFFDKNSFLEESTRSEDLNRSLWRTVGVSVLRKFYGFHRLRLQELQKMVQNAEFVDLVQDDVGEATTQIEYKVEEIRAKAASRVGKHGSHQQAHTREHQQTFSSTSSMPGLIDPGSVGEGGFDGTATGSSFFSAGRASVGVEGEDDDDGRIHVHKLKSNDRGFSLAKTLSNMGLHHMDNITDETLAEAATVLTPHSSSAQTLKVVEVEPRRLVLLVKGQLLPRPTTNSHPGVEMHMAPCLLTDVSGRLVFTKDTKMFFIPVSIVERARSSFTARRTRLEKAAHREDTIKDLNEHRLAGAWRMPTDDLEKVAHDALGTGGRTDLGVRQALTRKHSEMAKRASERGFFGADDRDVGASGEGGDVADGSSSGGGGDGGWGDETITPRRSFVMKRAWGSMKMVEMSDDELPARGPQLGAIMEERERASSAVSASGRTWGGGDRSPLRPDASARGGAAAGVGVGVGVGLSALRERLGSASQLISSRLGRSGSASSALEADVRQDSELEEKVQDVAEGELSGEDTSAGGDSRAVV